MAQAASHLVGNGIPSWGKSSWGMKLTTHPNVVPKNEYIYISTPTPDAFLVCSGTSLL